MKAIFQTSVSYTHLQFQQILFAEDTLAAIMPRTHPLAEKDAIGLEELANETLLLLSSDTFMYHLCVDKCKKAGFEPIVGYTGRRSENIIALVEKGAGIALLTQNPIMQLTNNNISIVKISPKIHTQMCIRDSPTTIKIIQSSLLPIYFPILFLHSYGLHKMAVSSSPQRCFQTRYCHLY